MKLSTQSAAQFNDMSYAPAAAVKNGVTPDRSNVDWRTIGTDPVDDTRSPASYQAVAAGSGQSCTG